MHSTELLIKDVTLEWLSHCTDCSLLQRASELIDTEVERLQTLRKAIGSRLSHVEERAADHRAELEKSAGNAALAAGEVKIAIEHYTAAINLRPFNAVYHANRAAAYLRLRQYAAALSDAQHAKAIDPTYIKAYSRASRAFEGLGELLAAADELRQLLERQPDNAEAVALLAHLQTRIGGRDESAESELAPKAETLADIDADRARLVERVAQGELEGAARDFENILERLSFLPSSPEREDLAAKAKANAATCNALIGEAARALEQATAVIEHFRVSGGTLCPALAEAMAARGLAYERLSRPAAAFIEYRLSARVAASKAAFDGLARCEARLDAIQKCRLCAESDEMDLFGRERLRAAIEPSEPTALARESALKLKTEGNAYFASKNIALAVEKYTQALALLDVGERVGAAVVASSAAELAADLLSNRALARMLREEFDAGEEDAALAHKLRPTEKTRYRLALNRAGKSRAATQRLLDGDLALPPNALAEIDALLCELSALSAAEPANERLREAARQTAADRTALGARALSRPKAAADIAAIAKGALQRLLKASPPPENSAAFESGLFAFKDDALGALRYVEKTGAARLAALYATRQIEVPTFLRIARALQSADETRADFVAEILRAISATKAIRLTVQMLSAAEKSEIEIGLRGSLGESALRESLQNLGF